MAFIVLTNLMNAISCQTRCWAYNVEELDMIPAVSELVLLRCIFFLIFFLFLKILFIYFSEGKGGRKRERETSMCG